MLQSGHRYAADQSLEGVVDHFYQVRLPEGAAPRTYHLAPSLEMIMVLNFGTPVHCSFSEGRRSERTIDKIGIIGPLRRMMSYTLQAGADLLVLAFTHNGLYRLLSMPIESLAQGLLPPGAVLQQIGRFEHLWERLVRVEDAGERVAVLTAYLVVEMKPSEPAALPLLESIPLFHDASSSPVKAIAAGTSLSERTVQLRFKKYVGYSPKELLRFLRFKQVLHTLLQCHPGEADWFEIIDRYGYHDQSHLNKDFKYYTGVPPKQFLKLNAIGDFCINRS